MDYQKDFVCGSLGFDRAAALEDGICRLVEQALEDGDRVIFTLDTHGEDYLTTREGRALPVPHCLRGSDGWRLYGKLERYMENDAVTLLPKESFGASGFGQLTAQDKPQKITLVGVVTNMCVISNAVVLQALLPQAEIAIESGLCAAPDTEQHHKALELMSSLQMQVR